ncbi:hypothetical protein [Corynebacterium glutamicum]|nr:hypothetical protein [Corynebacterium glutamicum]
MPPKNTVENTPSTMKELKDTLWKAADKGWINKLQSGKLIL